MALLHFLALFFFSEKDMLIEKPNRIDHFPCVGKEGSFVKHILEVGAHSQT